MKSEKIVTYSHGDEVQEFDLIAHLDPRTRIFDLSARKARLAQLGVEIDSGG